jgi:hypothetical protein
VLGLSIAPVSHLLNTDAADGFINMEAALNVNAELQWQAVF